MAPIPSSSTASPSPLLPRLIVYYQTQHNQDGTCISTLPLVNQPNIHLTHLILAAIHLNDPPPHSPTGHQSPFHPLTLNDHPPSHPRYNTLWAEMRILQDSGIKVLGMLGGAAQGTYSRLDVGGTLHLPPDEGGRAPVSAAEFEANYAPLAALIREHSFDGLDLDVETPMSLRGVIHLIDRLRGDFGSSFIITLAPVAAALLDSRKNLSGFSYHELEAARGKQIEWYNTQFYCGWGDCSDTVLYELIMELGGWPARKVVVGLVTNPENGAGWVTWERLAEVVPFMRRSHKEFGGIMGWEYFNALPGGRERPWEWARVMTGLLGRGDEDVGMKSERKAAAVAGEIDLDEEDGSAERASSVPEPFEYDSDRAE